MSSGLPRLYGVRRRSSNSLFCLRSACALLAVRLSGRLSAPTGTAIALPSCMTQTRTARRQTLVPARHPALKQLPRPLPGSRGPKLQPRRPAEQPPTLTSLMPSLLISTRGAPNSTTAEPVVSQGLPKPVSSSRPKLPRLVVILLDTVVRSGILQSAESAVRIHLQAMASICLSIYTYIYKTNAKGELEQPLSVPPPLVHQRPSAGPLPS